MDKRIFVCIAGFILLSSCGIGSAWIETQITTNKADQFNPSMYGNYIVWQDTRNGGSEIYLQNLATKIQTRVTKGIEATEPCVSGNKIVWQDKRNGNWDIYMYDISTKKTTRITTNTADQTEPGVYGNSIVWEDTRKSPGPGVYLLDLSTRKETRLTADGWSPAIYGKKIIWYTENGNAMDDVISYDISTKKTSKIFNGGMIASDLSIYGNRVIWNDMFTGIITCMYDFGTKKEVALPFDYVSDPALYDNKIVYDDGRNGKSDIYMAQI
jgi:beta propeller repeat protein